MLLGSGRVAVGVHSAYKHTQFSAVRVRKRNEKHSWLLRKWKFHTERGHIGTLFCEYINVFLNPAVQIRFEYVSALRLSLICVVEEVSWSEKSILRR